MFQKTLLKLATFKHMIQPMFYKEDSDVWWERTQNALITVAQEVDNIWYSSATEDNFCGYHDGVLNQFYTLIECKTAIVGQFIQIQLNATVVLNLYEVEVWGW